MGKFTVYVRHTIETVMVVEAKDELQAMNMAMATPFTGKELQVPDEVKIENAHRTIWRTEKSRAKHTTDNEQTTLGRTAGVGINQKTGK